MTKLVSAFLFSAALMLSMALAVPTAAKVQENRLQPALSRMLTIPEKVRYASEEAGLNSELMLCIARRESGFDPEAKNPRSTATGVFQILEGTFAEATKLMGKDWPPEDRLDPDKNIETGVWLAKHWGYTQWEVYTLGWCDKYVR